MQWLDKCMKHNNIPSSSSDPASTHLHVFNMMAETVRHCVGVCLPRVEKCQNMPSFNNNFYWNVWERPTDEAKKLLKKPWIILKCDKCGMWSKSVLSFRLDDVSKDNNNNNNNDVSNKIFSSCLISLDADQSTSPCSSKLLLGITICNWENWKKTDRQPDRQSDTQKASEKEIMKESTTLAVGNWVYTQKRKN